MPVEFFIESVGNALARFGFGYNDYICIFGQDPETDPGEEFDGVRVSLLGEEHMMPELDLFEGLMDACIYILSRHPGTEPELKIKIDVVAKEIRKLRDLQANREGAREQGQN